MATSDQQQNGLGSTLGSAYRYLLAWAVGIVLLALLNRSRLGHALIYYTLILMIAFLVVTQAPYIAAALAPLSEGDGPLEEPGPPGGLHGGKKG